jgi:AraC family transcriptional regulator of adaptative response/methylated-DNA-[protein]-cysteine methyltransferase
MYDAGYGSTSRLYEGSTEHLGMSPASYRRGGRGARITYTIVACPLGRLLVAATERGVCAVKLGGSNRELGDAIRREFPGAQLYPDDGVLGETAGALVRHLKGDLAYLDLPLDIRATAFQRQVWEYLRTIPYGETRSYQQVAAALGRPAAVRAVGRACGANPVALVVPCHRVVKRDGGLGGYRWGPERKAVLLGRERPPAEASSPSAEGAKSSREP